MLCACFYLKLILRLSRFRIIVTYTNLKKKKKKKKNKFKKKYNVTQLCILYITVSLLSRHAMLETKNGWEGDNNLLSPFLILQLWRSSDILNLDT